MQTFKIDGYYIQAVDEQSAKELFSILKLKLGTDRFIYLRSEDRGNIIDVPEDGDLEIWTKSGNSVQYCGKIIAGTGHKILQAAIDNVNISQSESAKLGRATRRANRKRRHTNDSDAINEFEKSVPEIAKSLYGDVMNRLEANTDAYKLEIIDTLIEKGVSVKSHNWIPILTWFRDKVLTDEESKSVSERRTFFQLRKAFVTTVARMAKDDVRHANTMRMVKEDGRDNDFWVNYEKDKRDS